MTLSTLAARPETRGFYDHFAAAAERFPARAAAELQRRDSLHRFTYRQLDDFAGRAAGWLAAHGIGPGNRVVLLADNDPEWCGAYLGVLRAGGVAVPLDTNYSAAQVRTLLADCGAAAVFTSERFAPTARAAASLPIAIIHTDFDSCVVAAPARDVGGDDPAVMLYTSGTTADPKGVVLSHRNIVAERTGAFQVVGVSERDVILSVLPLFHALAQMANLLLPFSIGACVVFLESLNTAELARALRDRGITAFVCVPQFFYLLHQRIDDEISALSAVPRIIVRRLASANLLVRRTVGLNPGRVLFRRIHRSFGPHLRLLVTGGARFDPEINRALFALGFTIRQAYGLTECSGAATVTLEGDSEFASVGPPIPGVELRIATSDLGQDGEGEILIRGDIVMQGYFNRPDGNAVTLRDGWLHTGDLGHLDDKGRLFVTGRSKEVIVLGSGKNIYPEEIEAHYEKSSFIQELCVVGLTRPGEPTAERLHALIRPDAEALRARGVVNIRELLRFELESLSVQLPAHKRILGYDVTLEPLPRTTTRKLKRFEIQKRLAEAQARAATPPREAEGDEWGADAATARILDVIREHVPRDARLAPEAHLELDLGLDSMERVELIVHLTGSLQVEIPDEDAQRLHTLGELVEACRVRLRGAGEATEKVRPWPHLLEQGPADAGTAGELRKPKLIRALLLFAVLKVVLLFARVSLGMRIRGREHLPASGPFIISPNHQSYADAFVMVASLPFRTFRQMFFVGAAEYFETPLTRWLARILNVIPIDPDANLVAAMRAGALGLRLGKVLVLFPEGERSIDGTVKTFRKGAAILSQHLSTPIVPVAIDGAWEIWPRGRSLNWRTLLPWGGARLRVAFGAPLAPGSDGNYAADTERLRNAVVAMWEALHRERGAA